MIPVTVRSFELVDEKLKDIFRQLVTGKARWPLYLHGPTGTGKTHAALCLTDVLAERAYFTTDCICQVVFQPGDLTWQVAREREVVIVDELGRDTPSEYDRQAIDRFTDARDLRAGRVAVYISNHPPSKMAEIYDDRIRSRVACGTLFELTGRDRRFTKQ